MIRLPIFRTLLVAMVAAAAAIPGMQTTAAIPCQELPVIEAPPDMVIPLIYLELPRTVEESLSRGQPVDREGSAELDENASADVTRAAENQFRCLGYGMDVAFAGNSTPGQRVQMFAVPDINEDTEYVAVESLYVVYLEEPVGLEDGRYLIDFGIVVDGSQYLTGELVFLSEDDGLYLDGGSLAESVELNEEPVVIEIGERFTREVKLVDVSNGDRVRFDNQEEEANAEIVIVNTDGETIFEGSAMGTMLVGGESRSVFVVHDLEPGEYVVTITFSPSGITYNVTLVVGEDQQATPVATPEY